MFTASNAMCNSGEQQTNQSLLDLLRSPELELPQTLFAVRVNGTICALALLYHEAKQCLVKLRQAAIEAHLASLGEDASSQQIKEAEEAVDHSTRWEIVDLYLPDPPDDGSTVWIDGKQSYLADVPVAPFSSTLILPVQDPLCGMHGPSNAPALFEGLSQIPLPEEIPDGMKGSCLRYRSGTEDISLKIAVCADKDSLKGLQSDLQMFLDAMHSAYLRLIGVPNEQRIVPIEWWPSLGLPGLAPTDDGVLTADALFAQCPVDCEYGWCYAGERAHYLSLFMRGKHALVTSYDTSWMQPLNSSDGPLMRDSARARRRLLVDTANQLQYALDMLRARE